VGVAQLVAPDEKDLGEGRRSVRGGGASGEGGVRVCVQVLRRGVARDRSEEEVRGVSD